MSNILFIGLVIFATKQWFLTLKLNLRPFCVWLSLARLPSETARVFSRSFFEKETALFSSSAPRTCSMPQQDFFGSYLQPSFVKCHFNSQNFSPF